MHAFQEPHFKVVIEKLCQFCSTTQTKSNHSLAGKTFALTGKLSQPRNIIQEQIEALGGKIVSSISKNTDYLVYGESPGSKFKKAKALNITLIDQNSLDSLLR